MTVTIEATAIHEASHCVAAVVKGLKINKKGVTIIPTRRAEGSVHVSQKGYLSRNPAIRQAVNEAYVVLSFAGPMAEYRATREATIDGDVRGIDLGLLRLIDDHSSSRAVAAYAKCGLTALLDGYEPHPEWRDQTYEIYWIVDMLCSTPDAVTALGKFLPDAALRLAASDHFRILGRLADEAHKLLDEHWSTVQALAQHLLQVKSLPGPDAEAFVVERLGYVPQRIVSGQRSKCP